MTDAEKAAEAHINKLQKEHPDTYHSALRVKRDFLAGYAAAQQWRGIESAPRDGSLVIVNDTNEYASPKVTVASYINFPEWCGWIYEDELVRDASPDGPKPTHWMPLQLPPSE